MTDYINETNENNLKKILIKYIKILNNKIIENKREGLIIYGFNYIPEFINNKYNKEYLKYLDFKYYLKNINILIIYNENFKDYIDNSIYQGQGNALLRKFRSDNINTITKRKESNVKASILGIPTGFYHYYNKLTNNINTNDPSVFNNEIKCEIIKSIIKIFIYILENEDIKYVFYSAADINDNNIGLNIFKNKILSGKIQKYIYDNFLKYLEPIMIIHKDNYLDNLKIN